MYGVYCNLTYAILVINWSQYIFCNKYVLVFYLTINEHINIRHSYFSGLLYYLKEELRIILNLLS